MADLAKLANPEFLSRLRALYPSSSSSLSQFSQSTSTADFVNPWFLVAAITYGASNRHRAVPHVYKFVLESLEAENASLETKKRVTTALRDAIYKAGLISGYSRVS